ncbi:hypothetical protein AWH48_01790 [Domibacillus aminovorans]|uniref:Uncharacterized protein n=1 Tax=Domibacillus aminovorans TaxID=29332 RepID=A0A177KXA7_9BACI|nr:hypothetical protein AWH48_01790 [Domibacillus aminovorans]
MNYFLNYCDSIEIHCWNENFDFFLLSIMYGSEFIGKDSDKNQIEFIQTIMPKDISFHVW